MKMFKKVIAMLLVMCMVYNFTGMFKSEMTAEAAQPVQLYYCDQYVSYYYIPGYTVYIKVNQNAQHKEVYVHHFTQGNEDWVDTEASYVTTLSDGSEIWKAELGYQVPLKYAIKYVGDGNTYWDNNNGNDYTDADILGDAVIKVDRISDPYNYENYKISATLKNLAYTKVVKVRYTQDNWATYQDVALSYDSSIAGNNTEKWSTTLNLDSSKMDQFEFCVYYVVNGQTYWDSNFGENYDSTYVAHMPRQ